MDALIDIFAVLGMFFLRLGVPLLLVIGVGYLLRRLDARWEAEAREHANAALPAKAAQRPGTGLPAQSPIQPGQRPLPAGWPQPQRLPAFASGAPASVIDTFGQPCWALNGCSETGRQQCPAYQQPGSPCWLARFQAEGKLPEACPQCPIYAATSGAATSGAATLSSGKHQGAEQWLQ